MAPVVGVILFLTAIHYLNFLARMALAPLLPLIENDLGLGHAAASSLFLFISVGYCAGVLASGFVAATLTHRHNITLSALLTGAALAGAGLSNSLWFMRLCLLAMGAAAGLYFPSGVTVVTTLANPRHWGKALGIHELAPSLGLVSAPLVAVALLGHTSWRGMLLLIGGCLAAVGLFNARFGPGSRIRSQMPDPTILLKIIRQPSIWILTALLSLAIGAVMGVYAILPLYLVSERGMDSFSANLILSLSRI
ncbi:MAG: MFS transporter, partial [Deltaproteobacteria bacterium]|nr:MFS transporter [Deltaproteobacteria bacterium]